MLAPDIAAQQMQLARQQQMAQILRDQALTPADPTQVVNGWAVRQSPLAGLSKVASALAAGYMQNETDKKQLELARALQGRMGDMLGDSGAPNAPAIAMAQGAAQQPSVPDDAGMPVNQGGIGPTVQNAARMDNLPPPQPNNFALGNLLKGSVIGQLGGEPAQKAFWDQFAPTEATKLANAAGVDVRKANADTLTKNNYIAPVSVRPGAIIRDPLTNRPIAFNPHVPEGAAPVFDAAGNVVDMQQIHGSLQAMENAANAEARGKAAVEPVSGYDAAGNPVFTNKLAAAQGGAATGGGAPVSAGRFGGYTAPGGNGAVRPGLAPGVQAAAEGMATQNTKRSGALTDAASESPTRVNVLDNILSLSKSGVSSGPNAEWTNKIKGAVADLPGFGGWKDDVTGYQELKKYLNQNGLRAWQAAGGSGTDSQLTAAQQANPNDKMFPKALQSMAQWAKAGELALQSKAAAQDTWLSRNGNNPQAQNNFESAWRQNFDPRIYQMKLMDPAELQTFVGKIPQAERAKLLQKYGTAKQNGWIQ
jgi:hypothetical protein